MKKTFIFIGAALLTFTLAGGGVWWWQTHRNPFPQDIRANAGIPLYYPTKLPPKFKINPDSFTQKSGVVLFDFDAPDGNKLHFTVQTKPAKLDLNGLYSDTLTDTKTIAEPLGTAHIGNLGENTMGSLVVGNTWIMTVYSQADAGDDLAAIIRSLKRY